MDSKQAAINVGLITDIIKMSENTYSDFQFESAYDYLENHYRVDKAGINTITQTPNFWKWWVNQWDRRNGIFIAYFGLDKCVTPICEDFRIEVKAAFYDAHSVARLKIFPGRHIMDETYCLMIEKLFKQERAGK